MCPGIRVERLTVGLAVVRELRAGQSQSEAGGGGDRESSRLQWREEGLGELSGPEWSLTSWLPGLATASPADKPLEWPGLLSYVTVWSRWHLSWVGGSP